MSSYPRVVLRKVASLGTGHTPSRNHPEYWVDCMIPWVTLADVGPMRDGTQSVVSETTENISELGVRNSSAVVHPAGTVVMSRTASVGYSAILGRDMATSQDYVTWACGPLVEPRFLLHALRGLRDEIVSMRMGSTHQTIYMPDVERIRVPLPPIEEQRRIADHLDAETARIDALIAKRHHQIELLRERDLAQVWRAVTGVGVRGERRTKGPAWLGDLPVVWPVAAVGSQFEVVLGRMLSPERVAGDDLRPYVRNVNVRWDHVDMSDTARMSFDPAERARLRLKAGDVLVNEGGAGIGRTAVWNDEIEECYFQKSVLRLRPIGYSEPDWFVECMRIAVSMGVLLVEGNLATIPHVPAEALRAHRFPFPPREVQRRMVAEVRARRDVDRALVAKLTRQIELLRERRQALITAMVTGETSVP